MKKKAWLFALILVICAFVAVFAVACGEDDAGSDDPDDPAVKVVLNKSELSLVQWTGETLTATVTGSEETVTWSSSQDDVASVDEYGFVTALKAGTATITASVTGASATCAVTVTASTVEPVLTLSTSEGPIGSSGISLFDVDTVTVTAKVTWDGLELDNAVISWTNSNTAAATVTPSANGYSATIEGIKGGTASVQVSATVRGKTASKTIPVSIVSSGVGITLTNEDYTEDADGYHVALKTVEETAGDKANETTPDVKVTQHGDPVTGLNIVWAVKSGEETDVVSIDNGKITALKAGTTVVEGEFDYDNETFKITLHITVTRVEVEIKEAKVVGLTNRTGGLEIGLNEDETGIEKVLLGGSEVASPAFGNHKLTLANSNFTAPNVAGISLKIVTGKREYTLTVKVADYAIATATEWETFYANSVASSSVKEWAGVAILENSINVSTVTATPKWDYNTAFNGTLDGQGYTVNGVNTCQWGLFSQLGANGVIQNIAFTNIQFSKEMTIIRNQHNGTVVNCYFEGSGGTGKTPAGFTNSMAGSKKTENVVLNLHDQNAGVTFDFGAVKDTKAVTNVYVINDGCTAAGYNGAAPAGLNYYTSLEAFKADVTDLPDGFSAKDWEIYEGTLIFKSAKEYIDAKYDDLDLEIGAIDEVAVGKEVTLSTTPANVAVVWAIDGLGASEYTLVDGVLTVTAESLIGSTFTLNAYYYERVTGRKVMAQSKTVTIVAPPAAEIDLGELLVGLTNRTELTIDNLTGDTVASVKTNGGIVDASKYSYGNGTLKLKNDGVFTAVTPGDTRIDLEIVVGDTTYTAKVRVADYAIGTDAEWNAIWNSTQGNTAFTAANLIVLEKDVISGSGAPDDKTGLLSATLDGQGHTVSNAAVNAWTGLFHVVNAGGAIKNINFVGIQFKGPVAVVSDRLFGTIENCYFEGSMAPSAPLSQVTNAALANRLMSGAVVKNVFIYFHDKQVKSGSVNTGAIKEIDNANVTVEELHVINDNYDGNILQTNNTSFSIEGKIFMYDSVADFFRDNRTKPSGMTDKQWEYLESKR